MCSASLSKDAAIEGLTEASFTQTTGASYKGAIFNATCNFEVVAPPTMTGICRPASLKAMTSLTISCKLGVISPESPIKSTHSSFAFFIILSAGTITPMSITS